MELEKCSYDAIGENVCCCKTEPFEGSENVQVKSVIENYDDYLNNKRFLERKTQECNDRYSFYREQERANMEMLKNLFLNEFIGSEKQIKGLCFAPFLCKATSLSLVSCGPAPIILLLLMIEYNDAKLV